MEELNLDDLNFDDMSSFEPLVASDDELKNLGSAKTETSEETKNKPKGDDTVDTDQESVAKGDDNKVQGGKTSADDEGSNSSSPKQPNDSEQLYSTLATQFKANGVLPGLEDTANIKSIEDINAAIKKEVESRFDAEQLAIKQALDLGLPAQELSKQMGVINQLKGISEDFISDENNVEFRKNAIAQDFLSKGYDRERAITLAQRSVDAGTDIDDAKFALSNIIGLEETKYQKIITDAKDTEAKNITDIKSYLEKTPEVIPGIKLNSQQSDELYKRITTDLGNKENAFMRAQKKDPVGARVKLEALAYLTKDFSDFSVFGKAKETDISKNIETLLRGANFTESGKIDTEINDGNASFTLKDLKDLKFE